MERNFKEGLKHTFGVFAHTGKFTAERLESLIERRNSSIEEASERIVLLQAATDDQLKQIAAIDINQRITELKKDVDLTKDDTSEKVKTRRNSFIKIKEVFNADTEEFKNTAQHVDMNIVLDDIIGHNKSLCALDEIARLEKLTPQEWREEEVGRIEQKIMLLKHNVKEAELRQNSINTVGKLIDELEF